MTLRIDYLNKHRECKHIFITPEHIGFELETIINQGATDIRIYNITKV